MPQDAGSSPPAKAPPQAPEPADPFELPSGADEEPDGWDQLAEELHSEEEELDWGSDEDQEDPAEPVWDLGPDDADAPPSPLDDWAVESAEEDPEPPLGMAWESLKGQEESAWAPHLLGFEEHVGLPDLDLKGVIAVVSTARSSSGIQGRILSREDNSDGTVQVQIELATQPPRSSPVSLRCQQRGGGIWLDTRLRLGALVLQAKLVVSEADEEPGGVTIGRDLLRGRFLVDVGRGASPIDTETE